MTSSGYALFTSALQEYISDFNNPLFDGPLTDYGATTTDDDMEDASAVQDRQLSQQDEDAYQRGRGLRSGSVQSLRKETEMADDFLHYLSADPAVGEESNINELDADSEDQLLTS